MKKLLLCLAALSAFSLQPSALQAQPITGLATTNIIAPGDLFEFSKLVGSTWRSRAITFSNMQAQVVSNSVRFTGGTNVSSVQTNRSGSTIEFVINTTDTGAGGIFTNIHQTIVSNAPTVDTNIVRLLELKASHASNSAFGIAASNYAAVAAIAATNGTGTNTTLRGNVVLDLTNSTASDGFIPYVFGGRLKYSNAPTGSGTNFTFSPNQFNVTGGTAVSIKTAASVTNLQAVGDSGATLYGIEVSGAGLTVIPIDAVEATPDGITTKIIGQRGWSSGAASPSSGNSGDILVIGSPGGTGDGMGAGDGNGGNIIIGPGFGGTPGVGDGGLYLTNMGGTTGHFLKLVDSVNGKVEFAAGGATYTGASNIVITAGNAIAISNNARIHGAILTNSTDGSSPLSIGSSSTNRILSISTNGVFSMGVDSNGTAIFRPGTAANTSLRWANGTTNDGWYNRSGDNWTWVVNGNDSFELATGEARVAGVVGIGAFIASERIFLGYNNYESPTVIGSNLTVTGSPASAGTRRGIDAQHLWLTNSGARFNPLNPLYTGIQVTNIGGVAYPAIIDGRTNRSTFAVGAFIQEIATLPASGQLWVNFNPTNVAQQSTVTGNIEVAFTNLVAGRFGVQLRLACSSGGPHTVTWPHAFNNATTLPAAITNGNIYIIAFDSWGTTTNELAGAGRFFR